MQLRYLVVAVALVGGCKKKKSAGASDPLAKMTEFARRMCECKTTDKVCADSVNNDMMKWATEMAKGVDQNAKPDPELAKTSADVMTKYTDCLTKIMSTSPDESLIRGWKLPPVPKSTTIDTLVKAARDSASAQNKSLALAKVEARYARSDGSLDPTYGVLVVGFGQPDEKDDPNRPIGAPVPEPKDRLTDCPTWTFSKGVWEDASSSCTTTLAPVRCNLSQIWKRALKEEAPAAALATMSVSSDGGKQAWTFTIVDEPRKIRIEKTYPDDCEPVVEQPK